MVRSTRKTSQRGIRTKQFEKERDYGFSTAASLAGPRACQWPTAPGVKRLLIFNGSPASLGDDIVSFLMEQATPEGVITAHSNLRAGQMVQVDGGPFDGLSGIIQEPPDARGRVKILLSLLKRQVKVEVPARYVKSGWVTNPPKPAAQIISSNFRST